MKKIILPCLIVLAVIAACSLMEHESGSEEHVVTTSASEEPEAPHDADDFVDEEDAVNMPDDVDIPGDIDTPGDDNRPGGMDRPGGIDRPGSTNRPWGLDRPGGVTGPDVTNRPRHIRIALERKVYRPGETVDFEVRNVPDGVLYTVSVISAEDVNAEPVVILNNSFVADAAGLYVITVVSGDDSAFAEFTVIDFVSLEQEFFLLTNAEREKNGLRPLRRDERLDRVALIRVLEIVEDFSHTRPDGRFFNTAFKEEGLPNREWAENLASGQNTPQWAVDDLMESRLHREAILDSGFRYMGVGVYLNDNGVYFWVQTFMG